VIQNVDLTSSVPYIIIYHCRGKTRGGLTSDHQVHQDALATLSPTMAMSGLPSAAGAMEKKSKKKKRSNKLTASSDSSPKRRKKQKVAGAAEVPESSLSEDEEQRSSNYKDQKMNSFPGVAGFNPGQQSNMSSNSLTGNANNNVPSILLGQPQNIHLQHMLLARAAAVAGGGGGGVAGNLLFGGGFPSGFGGLLSLQEQQQQANQFLPSAALLSAAAGDNIMAGMGLLSDSALLQLQRMQALPNPSLAHSMLFNDNFAALATGTEANTVTTQPVESSVPRDTEDKRKAKTTKKNEKKTKAASGEVNDVNGAEAVPAQSNSNDPSSPARLTLEQQNRERLLLETYVRLAKEREAGASTLGQRGFFF
jgi:hypothetical protein